MADTSDDTFPSQAIASCPLCPPSSPPRSPRSSRKSSSPPAAPLPNGRDHRGTSTSPSTRSCPSSPIFGRWHRDRGGDRRLAGDAGHPRAAPADFGSTRHDSNSLVSNGSAGGERRWSAPTAKWSATVRNRPPMCLRSSSAAAASMMSFSSSSESTSGMGTTWRRRSRPILPSTPPFSWAPSGPAQCSGSCHQPQSRTAPLLSASAFDRDDHPPSA